MAVILKANRLHIIYEKKTIGSSILKSANPVHGGQHLFIRATNLLSASILFIRYISLSDFKIKKPTLIFQTIGYVYKKADGFFVSIALHAGLKGVACFLNYFLILRYKSIGIFKTQTLSLMIAK